MTEKPAERIGRRGSVGGFLLRGGAWALAARVATVTAGLGVQMFLARLLPPEELGAYFLAQSVVMVSSLVGQLGLHRTVVRHIAESTGSDRPDLARGYVLPAFGIALLAMSCVAVLYAAGLGRLVAERVFHSPVLSGAVIATSAWVLAMGLQNITAEILRGFHAIRAAVVFGGALTSVITVGAFGVLWYTRGHEEFERVLWITVAATGINLAAAWVAVGSRMRGPRTRPPDVVARLMSAALPLAAASVLHAVFAQADLWIVGAALTPDQVALYGAAKRLIRLISLPLIVINLVIPPLIAELNARGESARLERAVRGAATLAGIPAMVVLIGFVAFPDAVLSLIYGEYYRGASDVLRVLSAERMVFVWAGPAAMTLMMTGQERLMLGYVVVAGVVTVAGAWWGSQVAGILGVAIGAGVGLVLQTALMWNGARRRCRLRTDVDPLHLGALLEAVRRLARR